MCEKVREEIRPDAVGLRRKEDGIANVNSSEKNSKRTDYLPTCRRVRHRLPSLARKHVPVSLKMEKEKLQGKRSEDGPFRKKKGGKKGKRKKSPRRSKCIGEA